MIKNQSVIELKKNDRVYQFMCDPSAPLGEVHDVLTEMKAYIVDRIIKAQEADKPKEEAQ